MSRLAPKIKIKDVLMDFNTLLRRLQKVKQLRNGEYQALCPAHNDKIPSLHIKQDGNHILLHCKAGCSIDNILQALQLSKSDLFIKEANPHQTKIVAE